MRLLNRPISAPKFVSLLVCQVKSGLSMVDVMNYISAPIQTINTGMAASMGSVLLGAGTKGMRASLPHSRTMLHQSSGGAGGNIQDARIQFEEGEKINKLFLYSFNLYNSIYLPLYRYGWIYY